MRILVITETDACCGPMAAAFLNDFSTRIEAVSAGRNPSRTVEPLMVEAMHECLIDMADYVPKNIANVNEMAFDAVYDCPELPVPTTMDEFRDLRDFIKNEAYRFFRGL